MSLFEESLALVPDALPGERLRCDGGGESATVTHSGTDERDTGNNNNGTGACELSGKGCYVAGQLVKLVEAKAEHARLRVVMQRLTDSTDMRPLLDVQHMSRMRQQLAEASALLQKVVEERAVLAVRLKDLSSKQSIPVEPEFQAQFSALLKHAAMDALPMDQRKQDLAWASSFSEPPSLWERQLCQVSAAAQECAAYHQQLCTRARLLSEYTDLHNAQQVHTG